LGLRGSGHSGEQERQEPMHQTGFTGWARQRKAHAPLALAVALVQGNGNGVSRLSCFASTTTWRRYLHRFWAGGGCRRGHARRAAVCRAAGRAGRGFISGRPARCARPPLNTALFWRAAAVSNGSIFEG
jgi:hypothetical protein